MGLPLVNSNRDHDGSSGRAGTTGETGETGDSTADRPRRRRDDHVQPPNQDEPAATARRPMNRRGQALRADAALREPGPNNVDHLAPFRPIVLNVRWATTAVALVLASSRFATAEWTLATASLVLLAYSGYRTRWQLRYTGSTASQGLLLAELAILWSVTALTGFWQSPLAIALAVVPILAGFAGGFRMALRIGATATLTMSVCNFALGDWNLDRLEQALQWTTILLLTGVIAGYTKRISGEASERHSAALDRMSQLSDANNLLFNLHRLAQTLPASLDQNEVLDSTLGKLRGLLPFDRAVVLLLEETDNTWTVAQQQALGLKGTVDAASFPSTARQAAAGWRIERSSTLSSAAGGFHPRSESGMYAPLIARDRLIGLLAIESHKNDLYGDHEAQTLRSFIEPVALAIDNARWFGRLRRVSVDEERSRIARELHDRIGQSLACLGFDADRTVRRYGDGQDVADDLAGLRDGVRSVTGEIRDALYDLRADVGEDKDFEHTMAEFADRVAQRSGLRITLDMVAEQRLPLLQEREMWRIAQEAVINTERHADAETVRVTWRCDEERASLEVADDGRGMSIDRAGRIDSYGIVGMRERANSVGASFEIISKPGEGTRVRCYLNQT